MPMQWITRLHRIEHAGMPVYIDQEKPDWFVPSTRTDELLRACQSTATGLWLWVSSVTVATKNRIRRDAIFVA